MLNSKCLNLIHLANFNSTNIGNGALVSGLETTMSEDLGQGLSWIREPWDNYTFKRVDFDSAFVKKVNESDGLIVGGAVTFNGRDYNDRTGTRFELPFELWSNIEKPVIFYGLSYRHWEGQTYHHIDKFKKFIELSLESKNVVLTLRNDGTKEWVKSITGIDNPSILEVPDSAVFVEANGDNFYPELNEGSRNVILSFNDEDAVNRFSQKSKTIDGAKRTRDRIVEQYARVVTELAQRYEDLSFILCPHYFDDYKMMSDFLEKIPPRIAHQRMVSTGLNSVRNTSYFYGRYSRAELAISMRVHSMSPSIGLGTPMVAYTTQDRMENFMTRIGLKDSAVDAFESNAEEALLSKAIFALENPNSIKANFAQTRSNLREETKSFHLKLNEILHQD